MIVIPCYEINTVTLEFKAKNIEIMMEVLKAMRLDPFLSTSRTRVFTNIGTFNLQTGKVDVRDSYADKVNKFRVKYSEAVIEKASKKFGWKIKSGKIQNGKKTLTVVKW